jgi:prepilin-type N-terminal cleavage/methylation domain-containing protein
MRDPRASFTLIELLIVIAVVAVLSVVVVLVLNPSELLKQARDSNRIADMQTLNKAVTLYLHDRGGSLGTASTTYLSLIDPTATTTAGTNCAGIGLVAPTSWSYHCAASSTARRLDGTGWIPLNFSSITFSPPFGALPLDPTNTSSSGLFYMYVPGTTTYAVAAGLNSSKYLASKGAGDGGTDPSRLEAGSNLTLIAQGQGLIGWWTFDEGFGTSAADSTGRGNTGTITSGTWVAGKLNQALSFSGLGRVDLGTTLTIQNTDWTVLAWIKSTSSATQYLLTNQASGPVGNALRMDAAKMNYYHYNSGWLSESGNVSVNDGNWHQLAWANSSNQSINLYVDSVIDRQNASSTASAGTVNRIANMWDAANQGLVGIMDELRIYSRALSPAEITAIYTAQR